MTAIWVIIASIFLFSCGSMPAVKITQEKPPTLTAGVEYYPQKKHSDTSVSLTGEWRATYDYSDNRIVVVFAPLLLFGSKGVSDWPTSQIDPGNYEKIPTLRAEKLYLQTDQHLFGYPYEVGGGIRQFTQNKNWWDFMNDPNDNEPWYATNMNIYPRSVPGVWIRVPLGKNTAILMAVKQYLPSILPLEYNDTHRPDDLHGIFDAPSNGDFFFNFDSTLSHHGKIFGKSLNTDLRFSWGKNPWPAGDVKNNTYSPDPFRFFSVGAGFTLDWNSYIIKIRPSFKWSDEADKKWFLATSIEKEFAFSSYKIAVGISHLAADTLERSDNKWQRLWDYRNSLGCSLSAYTRILLLEDKLTLGLTITSNYEEISSMFLLETVYAIDEKVSVGINGRFYWDETGNVFDQEDAWSVGAFIRRAF